MRSASVTRDVSRIFCSKRLAPLLAPEEPLSYCVLWSGRVCTRCVCIHFPFAVPVKHIFFSAGVFWPFGWLVGFSMNLNFCASPHAGFPLVDDVVQQWEYFQPKLRLSCSRASLGVVLKVECLFDVVSRDSAEPPTSVLTLTSCDPMAAN